MTCEWPVDRTCLPDLPADDDTTYAVRAREQDIAANLAVQTLFALSGRQFGVCEVTARPCVERSESRWRGAHPYDQSVSPYIPTFEFGHWVNYPCGCRGERCHLGGPRVAHLAGPVDSIVTVTIGTEVQDEATYTLEGDVLYRVGGKWPRQDLGRPLGEDHTWSVVYDKGNPVPFGVDKLTGQLAGEFINACAGNKCRLPKTVVSTTRQGVSHVFDPSRMLTMGFTGLTEVDSWIAAINPMRLAQGPRVI